MKHTYYTCTLCGERTEPGDLFGFKHVGRTCTKHRGNNTFALVDDLDDCGDRHLCRECISNIRESLDAAFPKR